MAPAANDPEAVQAFLGGSVRAALGLRPGDLDIGLRVAAAALARGDALTAVRHYTSFLLLEPLDPEGHLGLAGSALALDAFDAALAAAEAAVALAPADPRGPLLAGKAQLRLRRPAAARDAFAAALRLATEARAPAAADEARRFLAAAAAMAPA